MFVDGYFWHSCPEHSHLPKTNTAAVAQLGGDAQVALSSDLVAARRVGDDGERPGVFADVQAVPGRPAQRAQDDPVDYPTTVVDCSTPR